MTTRPPLKFFGVAQVGACVTPNSYVSPITLVMKLPVASRVLARRAMPYISFKG